MNKKMLMETYANLVADHIKSIKNMVMQQSLFFN